MVLRGRQGRGNHRHTDTHMVAPEQRACPPADKSKFEKGANDSTCPHASKWHQVFCLSAHP